MKLTPLAGLMLGLAFAPVTWGQTTAGTSVAPDPASQPKEDAQTKALREQLLRETAARKAEVDAAIAADIARNPEGAKAQAARKAAEEAKAQELAKQSAEEKAKADADEATKVAAAKDEKDRKAAAAAWAAGAAERERAAAKQKAAVDKWRATGKPAPSIMMSKRGDGTYVVLVDGKLSSFATAAEAQAYADKVRSNADTPLSY